MAAAFGEHRAPFRCRRLGAQAEKGQPGEREVKSGGPASPPTPAWLAERYAQQRTGQLARVWVMHEHRRNGVGRRLVTAAAQWAFGPGGYEVLCLHTDTSSPGALEFWQRFPASIEVLDARPDPWDTVHFELDPARLPVPMR